MPAPEQTSRHTSELFQPSDYRMCDSVGYLLTRARSLIGHGVEQEVSGLDITHAQASCLMALANGSARTVTDLGRELATDMGSVTRLLSRMEKRGLIERHRRDADRRVVDLVVTPAGHEVVAKLPGVFCRVLSQQFRGFSPEEIETLRGFLRRMIDNNTG